MICLIYIVWNLDERKNSSTAIILYIVIKGAIQARLRLKAHQAQTIAPYAPRRAPLFQAQDSRKSMSYLFPSHYTFIGKKDCRLNSNQ